MALDQIANRSIKSQAAFRTIGEVAREIGVPQHVLRFWETKFKQVHPRKRESGRRYYCPQDVALLRRIRGLLYDDGFTIKGVQKVLAKDSRLSGKQAKQTNGVGASGDEACSEGNGTVLDAGTNGEQASLKIASRCVSGPDDEDIDGGAHASARGSGARAQLEDMVAELAKVRDWLAGS